MATRFRFWWYWHRRYPFVLPGAHVGWCFYCGGWGADPRGGYECPICYGKGFEPC